MEIYRNGRKSREAKKKKRKIGKKRRIFKRSVEERKRRVKRTMNIRIIRGYNPLLISFHSF